MVSEKFSTKHPRAGEPTGFPLAIKHYDKIHTIRQNFEWWKIRMDEVAAGKAVLSVRVWESKPYNSKQLEIFRYDHTHKVGLQLAYIRGNQVVVVQPNGVAKAFVPIEQVVKNDGLSLEDFQEFFKGITEHHPMAIIHFTDFRYTKSGTGY